MQVCQSTTPWFMALSPLSFYHKLLFPIILASLLLFGAISPAGAVISPQILVDEALVVYDIPKGYTNAPKPVVDQIKDEYGALEPVAWVDFVAAYVPEAGATKLSASASERLVLFLEIDLIPKIFTAKDFLVLNTPATKFFTSNNCPERELCIENCRLALSRPQIIQNSGNRFTVGFLESFSCPDGMSWTMTYTTRIRVQNKKVVTIHQLCTSQDYRDILTFKKHYATTLANLRLR